MFNTTPDDYYYTNDHYVAQITIPKILENEKRSSSFYSPKKLISGYWKKDYSSFRNLQSKEIKSHQVIQKCSQKKQLQKLGETMLNASNCFENMINRQSKTDQGVQILKNKILLNNSNSQRVKGQEIKKIPGHLHKGTLLKNQEYFLTQRLKHSYILNSNKTQQFSSKSISPSNKYLLKDKSIKNTEHLQDESETIINQYQDSQRTFSRYAELKQNLKIRKSKINDNSFINLKKQQSLNFYNDQDIQGMNIKCLYVKQSINNLQNLVLIQFEDLLGFDENSYFGLQEEFKNSDHYEDYLIIRNLYFEKLSINTQFYIHKNINELLNSISKVFQIVLFTINYGDLLLELIQDKKIKVNGIFQLIDYKLNKFVVDISEISNLFKQKQNSKLIFIQPFQELYGQETYIPQYSKISYLEYYGQRFFIPYSKQQNCYTFRLLALPQLNMQSLYKHGEQKGKFLHFNQLIEQFTLALQNEMNFQFYLNKNGNKVKCINLSSYFRTKKQKILQQLYFIDTQKLPIIQDDNNITIKKKDILQNIIQNHESSKQFEQIASELIERNNSIIKKMRNYQQESVNLLTTLQKELQEQLIRLNYCEMFIDQCYYLSY